MKIMVLVLLVFILVALPMYFLDSTVMPSLQGLQASYATAQATARQLDTTNMSN